MAGIFWTEEELKIVKEMGLAGKSMKDILSVLKSRSMDSVRKQLTLMGIDAQIKPEIDYEAFKQIMKEGKKRCL